MDWLLDRDGGGVMQPEMVALDDARDKDDPPRAWLRVTYQREDVATPVHLDQVMEVNDEDFHAERIGGLRVEDACALVAILQDAIHEVVAGRRETVR